MTRRSDSCETKYCRGKRSLKSPRCPKCNARLYRQRNPHGYFLNKLRNNAKRRGVPFNLTLDDFRWFDYWTHYIQKKGRDSTDLTIDRIDRDDPRGYHIDNIQPMSLSENVKKYHDPDQYKQQHFQDDHEPDEVAPF